MQKTRKMNIRDLPNLLDENLESFKRGEKPKNYYFLCHTDLIVDEVIKEWFQTNQINVVQDNYPRILWEENEHGILEETKPPIYVFYDIQDQLLNDYVVYYRMLNCGRDINGDDKVIDFISKDVAPNGQFPSLDLKKRMFTVAHGFKEESGNRVIPLANELIDLFEVIDLDVDLLFYLEHEYRKGLELLNKIENNDDKEEIEREISYIKKLINTGFNIENFAPHFTNFIIGLEDCSTFNEWKSEVLERIQNDIGLKEEDGKHYRDCLALIDWLKNL